MRRGGRPGPPDYELVAGVAQRLAVLLGAGVAPASAWRHVAADGRSRVTTEVTSEVIEHGAAGVELARGLLRARDLAAQAARPAWSALAAAWWVGVEAGASLAPTLQRFAVSLRELSQSWRDVEVALAGPLSTSRTVLALPAVGLLLGVLLGFDAPRILLTTPPGWVCLGLGGALVIVAARWNGRLIRRARAGEAAPGLALELLAIAVSGGASLDRARELVELALGEAGLPGLEGEADAILAFSRTAGVPAAALLQAEAHERRRRARTRAQLEAARLGTKLLLPLGLCVLPAFVALGVAPIVIAILRSSVGVAT